MSTVIIKEKYRCRDDCKMSGCPSHEMELTFETVTNSYTFKTQDKTTFIEEGELSGMLKACLLYTSPSPRDGLLSRMPSSA